MGMITAQTGSGRASCDMEVSWTIPVVGDNCGLVSLMSTHTPGFTFPVGETELTYTATDAKKNQ